MLRESKFPRKWARKGLQRMCVLYKNNVIWSIKMNGYFSIFGWYAPETRCFVFGVLRRICDYIGICGIRQLRFWDFVILRRNREKFSRYFNFSWSRPWRSWSRPWRSWSRPWRSWSRQGRSGSRPWRAWTRPWRALTRPCCVKSRPWRFLGAPVALQAALGRASGPLWASHRRRLAELVRTKSPT